MSPLTKAVKSATRVLKWSTIRDFGGGWNVIDNDLNLSSKYAKQLDNVHRAADGSLQVRWGTRRFAQTNDADTDVVNFTTDGVEIETFNASVSVELTNVTSKQFLRGHTIRIAGVTGTYGGIAPANINGDRIVTAVADGGSTLTVTMGAAATGNTGPAAVTDGNYTPEVNVNDSNIVAMHYFDGYIVSVHADGTISRTNGVGVSETIWNDDIAGTMAGSPSGWSTITWASFASFGGASSGGSFTAPKLIVVNGTDRPVVIDFTNSAFADCQYLLDSGGNNGAVPIARYVESLPEFLVMAGDPTFPSALLVSDQRNLQEWTLGGGTSTAAPGLSTAFDLIHYVNVSDPTIRGIRRFRDQLVVVFDEATVLLTITAGSSAAEITINEVIGKQGALAHNSMVSIGDDCLMCDIVGVPSLEQALFTGGIRAERASQLIDPEIQALTKDLSVAESEDRIFALFNPLESQYMLFIPNDALDETIGFVYTKVDTLRIKAWAKFSGMNWRCGAVSSLGRTFFGEGKDIYLYGTTFDPIYSDKETSGAGSGTAIDFIWELPWADFDERTLAKYLRYLRLDTTGTAEFTAELYIDNILVDAMGNDNPTLSLGFVGGSIGGFGSGAQPYGGGRRTSDERLYAWKSKFILAKLRFSGSATEALKFVSVSLGYSLGSIRR